jgi:tRNA1Val (adenine37-N6)-methyltransferase
MNRYFQFKQFKVFHDKSSMKVGTDAVLLGCLTNLHHAKNILDVGCGSGIVTLVLAQRSAANIRGIDIHEESVMQAIENFELSIWKDRLTASLSSFQNFAITHQEKFDGIVTNPPFFVNSMKSPVIQRNMARHNDHLSSKDLLNNAKHLLEPKGIFTLILPTTEAERLLEYASKMGFFLSRKVFIQPKASKKPNRVILELRLSSPIQIITQQLIIREENNEYTKEYQKLTKDFYLAF